MSLTKNQSENIASNFSRTYDTWEIYGELYDCLERLINNYFQVFKAHCWYKANMINIKCNKFVCIIKSKRDHTLLQGLNKNCFIKVINQKTIKEPVNSIYDNETLFKIIVYK